MLLGLLGLLKLLGVVASKGVMEPVIALELSQKAMMELVLGVMGL